MEIRYLKELEAFYQNNPSINRIGIPEMKIQTLESEMQIKLPESYREFLFLAGERNNIFGDWNSGFDNLSWIQDKFRQSLESVDLHLNPFFGFAEYGRDQFLFFFLNEGDNPPVYSYDEMKSFKNESDTYEYYMKSHDCFSDYIHNLIS